MNKLIQEFEKASGLDVYGLGAKTVPWEATLERFTALVVNECCQQLLKEDIRYDGYGYNQYGLHNKLREHFGVEE